MSSGGPVATAFVEIRPDLTGFEARLRAAVASATRGVATVPLPLTASATQTRNVIAGQTALQKSARLTTRSLHEQADQIERNATQLNRFSRGIASTGLSMFGLRGATLAATSAFLAGAAGITAIAKAVGVATSFNSQLAVFGATTGATAGQLEHVSRAAKALGADLSLPGVSAGDAAETMTELAKAGLSVQNAIDATRGTLQLAGAAGISFADATELVASALNAFGLAGREAGAVADGLANAANAAQGSIVNMGIAFQQAAAVAHLAGLTFQDTAVFTTQLAKAGLTGSDAGTSLRTALIRLINPTKKAQEAISGLGITLRDAQGRIRPEVFVEMGVALGRLEKAQRDATLAIIFGQDAIRAGAILSKTSIQSFLAQREAIRKVGTAAEVNQARMVGLAGAGQNLSNTIETLALSLGQKATPSLVGFTNALTATVQAVAKSPLTGALGDSIGVIGDGFQKLGETTVAVAPALNAVASALAAVIAALRPAAILATVGAFFALRRVVAGIVAGSLIRSIGTLSVATRATAPAALIATSAFTSWALTLRTAFASTETFKLGMASLGSTIVSTVGKFNLILLGATAFAGVIALMATSQSALEKVTRRLADATNALAGAIRNANQAQDDRAQAKRTVILNERTVALQKQLLAEAELKLANSNAASGSQTRIDLENRVLVLTQDLSFATDDLARAQRELAEQNSRNAAAEQQRRSALNAEIDTIHELIVQSKIRNQTQKPDAFVQRTNEQITAGIRDRIRALQAEAAAGDAGAIAVRKRLFALLDLQKQLRGFGEAGINALDVAVNLVLNAKSLEQGLRQAEAFLRQRGFAAAADWVNNFILGLAQGQGSANDAMLHFSSNWSTIFQGRGQEAGGAFVSAFTAALGQAAGFARKAIEAQIGGGTGDAALAGQEAKLREAIRIGQTKGHRISPTSLGALQSELLGVINQRKGIAASAAAAAKSAASDIKSNAEAAQKALDDADQKFLRAMGLDRTDIEIKGAQAELTASLQDDIAFQRQLQNFFRTQIIRVGKSIHDALLARETIQSLRLALLQSQKAAADLAKQVKENAKQRIIDRRDRKQESLELNIEIAQTRGNAAAELKGHQALLKFLIDRQNHTTKGTVEWRRLQLKIEEQRKAIRDAKNAADERNKQFRSLQFEFLQAQSGFAANLLGNLIPTGSIAGTVGGTTGGGAFSTSAGGTGGGGGGGFTGGGGGGIISVGDAGGPQRPPDIGDIATGQTAAAQTATGVAGASHGQLTVLISVARAQLNVLRHLAARNTHPESDGHNVRQGASWDGHT